MVQERHVMITGPIKGVVTLEDGTEVNVTPNEVDVTHLTNEQVEEAAFLVGERYRVEGHPDDKEYDEDEGTFVQRPFVHDVPKKFAKRVDKRKTAGKTRREKKG